MNEIQAINDQNKVTEQLLLNYLSTLTEKLSDSQRMQFLAVSQAFNLNPFKREIYAVKYGANFNIIVGYETYLKRAETCPQYDGYDIEFGNNGKDTFCKCSVFRKDRSHATTSVVWMQEYNTGKSLWLSKPKVMLEKVAICTAFRRAFPTEYGGMPYTAEEITAQEEELKRQGYTEVKAEEPVHSVNPLVKFQNWLKSASEENPAAYEHVKIRMKNNGWNKPSMVPVNSYDDVKSWYAAECEKLQLADAMDAEPVEQN